MAQVVLIPNGRLGNNLFQLSLMNFLSIHCPNLVVLYPSFPEIGIAETDGYTEALNSKPDLKVINHQINYGSLIDFIIHNPTALIHCSAWGMDPTAYRHSRKYLRDIFENFENLRIPGKSKTLRFHIRGGDIWQTRIYRRNRYIHPDYTSIPISFYKLILKESQIPVEFVAESSVPKWYLNMLGDSLGMQIPKSQSSPIQDFTQIASSAEIGLGVSTFSWMAAYIGAPERVHMPVLGIFDARKREELNFKFDGWNLIKYGFENHTWKGDKRDREWLAKSECRVLK